MYTKILVPIDGSKPADNALDHAINLLKSVSNDNNNNKNTRILFEGYNDLSCLYWLVFVGFNFLYYSS
jgi:hypothetical protein